MSNIIIITGKQGAGKTTMCQKLAAQMHEDGSIIGGFIAPGTWKNGLRHSFDILDLQTFKTYAFASREAHNKWKKIHSFYFNKQSITKGEELLREHSLTSDWVFIDEVGKFEIQGKVWGPILRELLDQDIDMVLCIRDTFVDEVVAHFEIKNPLILPTKKP